MTDYAVPCWIFGALFIVIPLALIFWMTLERRRERRELRRGFEVKLKTDEHKR